MLGKRGRSRRRWTTGAAIRGSGFSRDGTLSCWTAANRTINFDTSLAVCDAVFVGVCFLSSLRCWVRGERLEQPSEVPVSAEMELYVVQQLPIPQSILTRVWLFVTLSLSVSAVFFSLRCWVRGEVKEMSSHQRFRFQQRWNYLLPSSLPGGLTPNMLLEFSAKLTYYWL